LFTGLIESLGKVVAAEDKRGQRKLTIHTKWSDLSLGESIAVNGVCLTVAELIGKQDAAFFVSEETLVRSSLGKLEEGQKANLERAMRMEDRLGGHIVQGHVDITGLVLSVTEGAGHHRLSIALDPKYGRYCVEKGSIAINGVSLTINQLQETKQNEFIIQLLIIPHTWKFTNLADLKSGDAVNIEVDILAKYIERLCPPSNKH
jgi:riboflavin synthase